MSRLSTTIFAVLAAVAVIVLPARLLHAQETDLQERRTLSLRTAEGLVVADTTVGHIAELTEALKNDPKQPSTNRDLFLWLVNHGVPANSMRVYLTSEKYEEEKIGQIRTLEWSRKNVEQAVRDGDIPDITGSQIFEAYMMIQAAGSRVFIDKISLPPGNDAGLLPFPVFVLSSASASGDHGIFINGKDLSQRQLGYNLVLLSPDGDVLATNSYNLFESPENSEQMAALLNSQPAGTILIASINTAMGVFLTSSAVDAFAAYGSVMVPDPEVLTSHAVIGVKGWAPGRAIEKGETGAGTRIILFNDSIYVDPSDTESIQASGRGRAAVISGTSPDDPILLYMPD